MFGFAKSNQRKNSLKKAIIKTYGSKQRYKKIARMMGISNRRLDGETW